MQIGGHQQQRLQRDEPVFIDERYGGGDVILPVGATRNAVGLIAMPIPKHIEANLASERKREREALIRFKRIEPGKLTRAEMWALNIKPTHQDMMLFKHNEITEKQANPEGYSVARWVENKTKGEFEAAEEDLRQPVQSFTSKGKFGKRGRNLSSQQQQRQRQKDYMSSARQEQKQGGGQMSDMQQGMDLKGDGKNSNSSSSAFEATEPSLDLGDDDDGEEHPENYERGGRIKSGGLKRIGTLGKRRGAAIEGGFDEQQEVRVVRVTERNSSNNNSSNSNNSNEMDEAPDGKETKQTSRTSASQVYAEFEDVRLQSPSLASFKKRFPTESASAKDWQRKIEAHTRALQTIARQARKGEQRPPRRDDQQQEVDNGLQLSFDSSSSHDASTTKSDSAMDEKD